MGNHQSKDGEFENSARLFSPISWEDLRREFRSMASQSRSGGRFIIASVFQTFYGIHGSLGSRLFELATRGRHDQQLTLEDHVVVKAKLESSPEEREEFLFALTDLLGDGHVTRLDVEAVISSILETVLGPEVTLPDESLQAFVRTASFSERQKTKQGSEGVDVLVPQQESDEGGDSLSGNGAKTQGAETLGEPRRGNANGRSEEGSKGAEAVVEEKGRESNGSAASQGGEMTMTMKDFREWCQMVPSVRRFLERILSRPTSAGLFGRIVPPLEVPNSVQQRSVLLRPEHAWHLAGMMQEKDVRQKWVLLFNSTAHGMSFNTFLGKVGSTYKQTILVVKDKGGAIFGGLGSQAWERHSDFYGDMKSFIFTLQPKAALYRPSGNNVNMQWCAVNFTSESIPNGIGFGGQIGHFALFLDGSFERGHSRPSATFLNNPSLSLEPRFEPDVVECWGLESSIPVEIGGGGGASAGGTILERFKEEKEFMKMAGIGGPAIPNSGGS
eukprot:TRINITY_DN35483_c0_g1_i1.p1 TRINITY_DN35483_c0_g1~~TRINITY_DN35483_c0_g1_i1.p1  ORF type:complete len:500 (-),score=72.89 TRINITY_DN35483_c0_g1_i1:580-2079(-)